MAPICRGRRSAVRVQLRRISPMRIYKKFTEGTQTFLRRIFPRGLTPSPSLRGESHRSELTGAKIRGATLTGTFEKGLTYAQFYSTESYQQRDLTEISLENTTVTGIDLSNQNLTRAKLGYANLRDADLSGANLLDASMLYGNVAGAEFTEQSKERPSPPICRQSSCIQRKAIRRSSCAESIQRCQSCGLESIRPGFDRRQTSRNGALPKSISPARQFATPIFPEPSLEDLPLHSSTRRPATSNMICEACR